MFGRGWMVVFLLGAAFLPYLLSSKSAILDAITAPFQSEAKSSTAKTAGDGQSASMPNGLAPLDASAPAGSGSAKSGVPARTVSASKEPRKPSDVPLIPLEQSLQWNVKPAWVMSTWPRVTTALPELDLQGYRVSFISGVGETDVAGSLSYYFDSSLSLRKIVFQGSTGDARRLVQFLMSQHRFERRLSDDPSVYLYQVPEDGRALSELRIRTVPIVKSTNPLSRFEVSLEMRRPE